MGRLIYVVDDEKNIRELIRAFLIKEGFEVSCFEDGESLLEAFEQVRPDLMILDIMLPGIDGLTLCATIRRLSNLPIIMVSAKGGEMDRVTGITLGGDDYLVKPFSMLELIARIKAIFRRMEKTDAPEGDTQALFYGDMALSRKSHEIRVGDKSFAATPTEFDFLSYMLENAARAVSRKELLRALWQFDFDVETRATDDLVKRLRRKLTESGSRVEIETVWGYGYRLSERGAAQ